MDPAGGQRLGIEQTLELCFSQTTVFDGDVQLHRMALGVLPFISLDDAPDDRVAHHVARAEADDRHPLDPLRPRDRVFGRDVTRAPPGGDPSHGYARSSRITMAFDTGVFDFVAV